MTNLRQVFEHIDWKLLAEQKQALVESLDSQGNSENLEGILNLLDAIQDAAEKDGFPVVFLTEGSAMSSETHRNPLL